LLISDGRRGLIVVLGTARLVITHWRCSSSPPSSRRSRSGSGWSSASTRWLKPLRED